MIIILSLLGVAVIFAQFPINQFRSIAWYNVAVGLAVMVTQLLIFRGESSCNKLTNCSSSCKKARTSPKVPSSSSQESMLSKIASTSVSANKLHSHISFLHSHYHIAGT